MADQNVCAFTGRLTRDPELRHTQSGDPVASFSIAVNGWKDGDVTYLRCSCWGKQAKALEQHFRKGDPIAVNGRLKLNRWEKDGQKREQHELDVRDWSFTQGKPKQGGGTPSPDTWGGPDNFATDETPF